MASPPHDPFPPPVHGPVEGVLDPGDGRVEGDAGTDAQVGLEELVAVVPEQSRFDSRLPLDHAARRQVGPNVRHDAGPVPSWGGHDVKQGGPGARPVQSPLEQAGRGGQLGGDDGRSLGQGTRCQPVVQVDSRPPGEGALDQGVDERRPASGDPTDTISTQEGPAEPVPDEAG